VPADGGDVDDDGNTGEGLPWDASKANRTFDAIPGDELVDMGAMEAGHLAECPFDLNGDGGVGMADLAILLSCYGSPCEGNCCASDLDCSGIVDINDLTLLLAAYGPCGESFGGSENSEWPAWFYAWAIEASIEELLAWRDQYLGD
jgi:hypothetical protein